MESILGVDVDLSGRRIESAGFFRVSVGGWNLAVPDCTPYSELLRGSELPVDPKECHKLSQMTTTRALVLEALREEIGIPISPKRVTSAGSR